MCAFDGKIGDRRAVHRDAVGAKLLCRQPGDREGSPFRRFGIACIKFGIGSCSRQCPRNRRLQALNAAAFLVNQNEKILPPDGLTYVVDQPFELTSVEDVAAKQNQPGGPDVAIKAALVVGHDNAGQANDQARSHRSWALRGQLVKTRPAGADAPAGISRNLRLSVRGHPAILIALRLKLRANVARLFSRARRSDDKPVIGAFREIGGCYVGRFAGKRGSVLLLHVGKPLQSVDAARRRMRH